MEAVVQEHTSLAKPNTEIEALVAHLRTQADKLVAAAQNKVALAAAQAVENKEAPLGPTGQDTVEAAGNNQKEEGKERVEDASKEGVGSLEEEAGEDSD